MALRKSRDEVLAILADTAEYKQFQKVMGTAAAKSISQLLIEEELKCQDNRGNYSPGKTEQERSRVRLAPDTAFKLKDENQLRSLVERVAITLEGEITKRGVLARRANGLFSKVASGSLGQEAQKSKNQELEAKYYREPADPPENPEHAKAKAWLKHGVQGSVAAYDEIFAEYVTLDTRGRAFLGADATILVRIWRALVKDAPPYRMPSPEALYPSSFVGEKLIADLLRSNGNAQLPPRGVNPQVWRGHAVYWFGTIMSVQPFPDGNKRVARAVYAIFMARAGIPFAAPNGAYGASLAAM